MVLHLVSGREGTGKSTIYHALKARGFSAIHADTYPGLSCWVDNGTGMPVPEDRVIHPLTDDWLSRHSWSWNADVLHSLVRRHEGRHAFLCGGAANERQFHTMLGFRFYLWIDDGALVERLRGRDPFRWTEGSVELANRLAYNSECRTDAIADGAIALYAEMPAQHLAADVIAYVTAPGAKQLL